MLGGLFGGGGSWKKAYRREKARLKAERRRHQQKEVWQTKEGGGIQERADISLGFDDSEEELDELNQTTGLMI